MNSAVNLTKAKLIPITWGQDGTARESGSPDDQLTVQFNPATLKVTYSNQVQTNDQSNNASTQFVGRGSAKLALELIFDIAMSAAGQPAPSSGGTTDDVRRITQKLLTFMTPQQGTAPGAAQEKRMVPPGVRLLWGSFRFDGIIESLDETLELWSEDGRPLRSTVAIGMTQQGIALDIQAIPPRQPQTGTNPPGLAPLESARQDDTMQAIAQRAGRAADWKRIAEQNGIEDPRHLPLGTLLNLDPARPGTRR